MAIKDIFWLPFPFIATQLWKHGESTHREGKKEDKHRLERLARLSIAYTEGYKLATGQGKRHEGAHLEGLDAVCVESLRMAYENPTRNYAHRIAAILERKLRP